MHLGLDLGSSRFRALRRDQQRLLARQVPTSYTAIEGTPAQQRLLSQARILPVRTDDACLIVGSEAEQVAAAFSLPLISLLPEGKLPTADPLARQVTAELLSSLLGPEQVSDCTLVLTRDVAAGTTIHKFLIQMLRLRGMQPRVITAAQAVALAELGNDEFAGVILCCGAAGASLSLVEHGEVQVEATTNCGGDWIDQQLAQRLNFHTHDTAGRRFLDVASASRWKRSSERSLQDHSVAEETYLHQAYVDLLRPLMNRFRTALLRAGLNGVRRRPLPIVCQGGSTLVSGFVTEFDRLWSQANIDLTVATPRLARDDNWAISRGCLIHAALFHDSAAARAA